MPSTRWRTANGIAALAVLAYAVVAAELLLGFATAGLIHLLGWVIARRGTERFVAETGRRRFTLVGALAVLTFGYGVVIAAWVLGGLAVAELLVLLAWTSGPDGPVVRAVRWVKDTREDLRAVRESLDCAATTGTGVGPDAD